MKTSILKKMVVMLCISLLSGFITLQAVTHGSIKGLAVPLYAQGATGGALAQPIATASCNLDYKVVTKGTKSWASLHFNGTAAVDLSGGWTSQLRYWSAANAKTENNLTVFLDATNKNVQGTTTNAIPANPMSISIFQALVGLGYAESLLIPYDPTAKNSPTSGDVIAPVVSACNAVTTETTATLTFTGSDNSNDLFYYVVDATHGIEEFALASSFTLNGLTPLTTYNLTITPIDFNGNEGTPLAKSFTTGGLVQITSGIAQDIKFAIKSTATTLEYYYEYTDPTKRFNGATLGITPAGGAAFDVTPTISPDSTYCYGTTNDARIASKIIALNFKYFTYKLPIDFTQWIVSNSTITSGTLTATAIKHQMGSGPSTAETEAVVPVINSVSLADVTSNYVKLNINGSDNSGTVYYTISGAKSTVNAYRSGNYFLTAIDPGKVYTLTVKPYDLSGNTAAAKTLTVKTMNVRSNIKDSTTTNYNTLILPVAPAGELVTIIQQTGNTLTLGCTTKSLKIPAGGSRSRKFNHPTVVIGSTTYPLTISADSLTATVTFTGTVGTTAIATGASLQVRWSVYWGSAGTGGIVAGGNFFTGTFTYVIGDSGQTDVTGPSTPALTLAGSSLSWPASTDNLSGVKSYVVSESGQTPVTIFDLGGASFSYNLVSASSPTTVKAIDFVGNSSTLAGVNGAVTANQQIISNTRVVYPNPATDKIYVTGEVSEIALYSLQGQLVHTVINRNSMEVSTFAKGLYIVRSTDKSGNKQSSKLEIK